MKILFRASFFGAWIIFSAGPAVSPAFADLAKDIEKLPAKTFCINANFQNAWEETAHVLRRLEIVPSLVDSQNGVIATNFVLADYSQLLKIASNPRVMLKGRFTLKIFLKEESPSFTKMSVTLQVRQNKYLGKSERILKSRGSFEKYLAYLVNQRAILRQFSGIENIRLGMSLIPDLKTERYKIANIEEDSPAGEAGFRAGDELLAMDGKTISIRGELFESLLSGGAEHRTEFKILRGRKKITLPVWVVKVPEARLKLGIQWERNKNRLIVKSISLDSKAYQAGIRKDDSLISIQGHLVADWTEYYRALSGDPDNLSLEFSFQRGSDTMKFVL